MVGEINERQTELERGIFESGICGKALETKTCFENSCPHKKMFHAYIF